MLIGIESAGAVACCSSPGGIVGVSLGWLRWLDVTGRRGLVVALSFLGSCCGVEMMVELKELSGLQLRSPYVSAIALIKDCLGSTLTKWL